MSAFSGVSVDGGLTVRRLGSRRRQPPGARGRPAPRGPWAGVRRRPAVPPGEEPPVQVDGLGPRLLAVRGLVHHAEIVLGGEAHSKVLYRR